MSIATQDDKFGYETLQFIENIEVINCMDQDLIKKQIQSWSTEDVGIWLKQIGLSEYVIYFKKNDISGKELLIIKEEDLKKDLNMISFGHRKIFLKQLNML